MCVRACNDVFSLGVVLLSISVIFISLAREYDKGAGRAEVEAGLETGAWAGDGWVGVDGLGLGVGGLSYRGFPGMVRPPHRPVCMQTDKDK